MTLELTDYLPNGIVVAFATIAGWVFRDHAQRDESRFKDVASSFKQVSAKLDAAVKVQAENHAEILKILLEQRT